MAERALPIKPAQPAYVSMPNAVRAAILHGNTVADITLTAWEKTYGCTSADIEAAWTRILSEISQQPSNAFDVEGK